MNDDDKLISKLISETYDEDLEKDPSSVVVNLRNYFEKKLNEVEFFSLNDYFLQNTIDTNPLLFVKEIFCYRLARGDLILDFPINWSVFKNIEEEKIVYIDESLDEDFLLDIFYEITGNFSNLLLLKNEESLWLIYLPKDSSKKHLEWFKNYLEKKSTEIQEKKAA